MGDGCGDRDVNNDCDSQTSMDTMELHRLGILDETQTRKIEQALALHQNSNLCSLLQQNDNEIHVQANENANVPVSVPFQFQPRLQSMRQNYSFDLLTQFYEEQMIPHFPLEVERDSLEDWIYCLDPAEVKSWDDTAKRGPLMDVFLLVCDVNVNVGDELVTNNRGRGTNTVPVILAGVAFEYYQQAEVGLISYVTVHHDFQRMGLMKRLHPLAIQALNDLHKECKSTPLKGDDGEIKAIFAETNTIDADDASLEEIMERHKALFALGYRLVEFPYSQPPLGVDQEAFEDVMLLVYQGERQGRDYGREGTATAANGRECDNGIWLGDTIPSSLPHSFVVDFFMSVYGYSYGYSHENSDADDGGVGDGDGEADAVDDNVKEAMDEDAGEGPKLLGPGPFSFQKHPTHQLSKWFVQNYPRASVKVDLPWIDVTGKYKKIASERGGSYDWGHLKKGGGDASSGSSRSSNNIICNDKSGDADSKNVCSCGDNINDSEHDVSCDHATSDTNGDVTVVAIVGAGAAGLSAAVQIAKNATSPIVVKLIEANKFAGGRIRTILTSDNPGKDRGREQYVSEELVDRCKAFAPWPVPIGAEFIHGVDSVVNNMIEDQGWSAEETFDFCTTEEYPSRNSFVLRNSTTSLSDRGLGSVDIVKIFGEGRCWDLRPTGGHSSTSKERDYGDLVKKANEIWDEIYSIGTGILPGGDIFVPPQDMALSDFTEKHMRGSSREDVGHVKMILDAVYARTAGTSIDFYGVNEACREELTWDYTESNFRTKNCFAEIIQHYLEEIESINSDQKEGQCKGTIELIRSTPISKVGSSAGTDNISKVVLSSRDGRQFTCEKVLIAVPLGVLKAGKIEFCGKFSIPPEKKHAIEKVNFYSGMKAHMLLRKGVDVVTSRLLENTDLFFCPGEIFVQVWVRRDDKTIFLTGFVVADGRDRLLSEMKDTRKTSEEIFLNQLERMLHVCPDKQTFINTPSTCFAFDLHDWSEDEFTMGIYSSPSIGAGWQHSLDDNNALSKTARDDIKAPIENDIYFAGEHANIKTCATVQAAIESGLVAASDILESLKRKGEDDAK